MQHGGSYEKVSIHSSTPAPKEAPKVKIPANTASTKGPQKKQKFFKRFTKKEETSKKRPTECGPA